MVKFKLKGQKHNTWPIKVKKQIRNTSGDLVELTEKVHLSGSVEYNSDTLRMSFDKDWTDEKNWNEVKRQLGANISWYDGYTKE